MQDILVKDGLIVTTDEAIKADLLIADGLIACLGENLHYPDAKMIDATDKYVMPGGIDAHTHLNLQIGDAKVSDGFYEGSAAAAFGGTTCVVEHPSFGPAACSLMHQIQEFKRQGNGSCVVDFALHGVFQHVTPEILDECSALLAAGVSSGKIYMTYAGRLQAPQVLSVLKRSGQVGLLPVIHAESHDIIDFLVSSLTDQDIKEPRYHALTRPNYSEAEAICRVVSMAEAAGGIPIYIAHLSTAAGLEVIESARSRGLKVYTEVCPQHLLLTDSCYQEPKNGGFKYVMAPPPRKQEDIEALWQGLARGAIDVVASDHCSFNFSDKLARGKNDFRLSPGGIPGVETRLSLLFSEGVLKDRISLNRFVELVSTTPAKLMGLFPSKGHLVPGADGDVIVFDPNFTKIIYPKNLRQNADYSPYEGLAVRGWPTVTIIRGHIVARQGQLLAKQGWGQYISRRQALTNSTTEGEQDDK